MRPAISPLGQRARSLAQAPFAHLARLLGPWLCLPERFGQPQRERLFSPLACLLALPGPSPRAGPSVRRSPQKFSLLAGAPPRARRLAQYGGLLPGPKTARTGRYRGSPNPGGRADRADIACPTPVVWPARQGAGRFFGVHARHRGQSGLLSSARGPKTGMRLSRHAHRRGVRVRLRRAAPRGQGRAPGRRAHAV